MTKPNPEASPAACSLGHSDLATRRTRWSEPCDRALFETKPTDDGVRLRFDGMPGVKEELDELTALERECCSFASWSVRIDRDQVVLDVSAGKESVGAVRQLLQGLPSPNRDRSAKSLPG